MFNCILSTEHKAGFARILAVCTLVGIVIFPIHHSVAQDCSCGAPCYVLLENDSLYGVEDLIACLSIEIGPNVTVEESADVTFSAGESIIMNNDVLINESATVAMDIDPLLFCDLTADLDEDLSDACLDCNDDDSSVFPGAEETCDDLDNDCDGEVDEGTCDDAIACTIDTCLGDAGCQNTVAESSCLITGSCYGAGQINPSNACSECDPGSNPTDWTPVSGTPCNDGDSCTSDDTCLDGSCAGTPIIDAFEPNDTLQTASNLGSIDDDGEYPSSTESASLYEAGDTDWFKFHVTDTDLGSTRPDIQLTDVPSGSDYTLCTYFECDDPGNSQSVDCERGYASSYSGLPGCCSSNSGSASERASFAPKCDNDILFDDLSGSVYVRVYKSSGELSCNNYSVIWGDN